MRLTRITVDPRVCTGKPCIRGLRFPVARLLGLLAIGETKDFQGATGVITINDKRDAVKSAVVLELKSGAPHFVASVKP